ncbi:DNA mismatch repair protein MutS [Terrihabitans soli]|uniref:DNA mismatch repair protein MutS n=1 Tax=Terrihabitans soli TaxID=708113 RepID=A0A6S6QSU4_9HYPH|nr:DNA mismatch repair protein MutS [Terrihabitans soli]BCJ92169.1 DNA mismatch repair protein MutS [Terrihabitans soli]
MNAREEIPSIETGSGDSRVTPMMEQYLEIKTANPDCLLFYRMGDFYELFFEDAEQASRALGIMLTKRGKHQGQDIPMCGVPVERADDYLQRLISKGFRVAVCEQIEDPAEAKKRGGKSVVKRDVVRLVTPGTLTEDALLDPRRANRLIALARVMAGEDTIVFGLAALDISTGTFTVSETTRAGLAAAIARLDPAEIVVPEALLSEPDLAALLKETGRPLAPVGRDISDAASAERRLSEAFGVSTIAGFGALSRAEVCAGATGVSYIVRTQRGAHPPLAAPQRAGQSDFLDIDAATRANLELTRTMSGERVGSLLDAIDRTVTAAGGRLLSERLASPLTDPDAINRRLDSVETFTADAALRRDICMALRRAPDLARAVQRLAFNRGGPRDLAGVRDALIAARAIAERLGQSERGAEIASASTALAAPDPALAAQFSEALAEELPVRASDGGFVRPGFDAALDEQRQLRDESRRVIAQLQQRYAEETGHKTLRIKHTNFLGFFVEVPAAAGEELRVAPWNATFVHRQTLQGAMRFSTVELGDLESRIAAAADRALALEMAVFTRLSDLVASAGAVLQSVAQALAVLDVASAFAQLAAEQTYMRPEVDLSLAFDIKGGRHPVVEQALVSEPFIANHCDLSPASEPEAGRIYLITGPNMGGKSTFLRQNALIAILAQAGSFVPAASARLGVVDRLFSRVGAADDLARGRSTFMVEMVETAAILNQASRRSLVILDEIGRGTSTFDGLSIAWAAIEHLHEKNSCRSLFATHFHELTQLSKRLGRLHNATLKVAEHKGDVVFLHEVVPGTADRSYGIQVAKLAGLPPAVVDRAGAILAELESRDRARPKQAIADDLPLFSIAPRPAPVAAPPDPALLALDAIDPDELTPRAAQEALYRLKALRKS